MFLSSDKQVKAYRCAIYTRLSDQEKSEISKFDSIEAQREICERYITLHEEQGWTFTVVRYDDRNISGGKIERPALRRLIADAKEHKFDMIIVKSIDRFTRNLRHFYDLWDMLQKAQIELASATQEFNTASPTGRLHLDIVLRFAQYERELASERTRDKMRFRASKGLFHGGYPPLGFDFHPTEKGILNVNKNEVGLVKSIFAKYLELQSAQIVAAWLNKQGHRTKSWKTKENAHRGDKKFTKGILLNMLRNVAYIGRTGNLKESYQAKWPAILSTKVFNNALKILNSNGIRKSSISKNKHHFLLTGLIWCSKCGSQMTPNPAHAHGNTYLYYRCSSVIHSDKTACSIGSVPARAIEDLVIKRIDFLAKHPQRVDAIIRAALKNQRKRLPLLREEKKELLGKLAKVKRKAEVLVKAIGKQRYTFIQESLNPLEEQRTAIDQRLVEIDEKLKIEESKNIDPRLALERLQSFNDIIDKLPFERRRKLLYLLINKITYDNDPAKLKIEYFNIPDAKETPDQPKDGQSGAFSSYTFGKRTNWLPREDSNLGHSGYDLTPITRRVGLYHCHGR